MLTAYSAAWADGASSGGDPTGVIDYNRIDAATGSMSRLSSWTMAGHTNAYGDVWTATVGGKQYAYLSQFYEDVIPTPGSNIDIIDVTDSRAPIRKSSWTYSSATEPPALGVKDVQVLPSGFGALASDNGGGVFIVDFRNPAAPKTLYRIYPGSNCSNVTGMSSQCDFNVHNIWINGDYVYMMHWSTPMLRIFQWANAGVPIAPKYINTVVANVGSQYWGIHDLTVKNGLMIFSCAERVIWIDAIGNWGVNTSISHSDITSGMTLVYDVKGATRAGASASNPLYLGGLATGWRTHSNWLTDDGKYDYVTREVEGAGIQILKLNGFANPTLVKTISPASIGITDPRVIPHNPVVYGSILYVSWYTEGLRAFDITDPVNPVQIGTYDVYQNPIPAIVPPDVADAEGHPFRGIWGVDPFLGNDKVIAADIETGLHILNLTPNTVPSPLAHLLLF